MTDRPVKNISASVRQRLLNLRQDRREDYNALLAQYAVERFLFGEVVANVRRRVWPVMTRAKRLGAS